MKTFLLISLELDIDAPLADIQALVRADLEYALEEHSPVVHSIKWNREQSIASLPEAQLRDEEQSHLVSMMLKRYNLTLPKPMKGEPEWRVPTDCYGEIAGLPTLRGKLVLTNGIHAFLVKGADSDSTKCQWAKVHYNNFIPDKEETLPYPKTCKPDPRMEIFDL